MREIKFRAWDGEKFYSPLIEDGKVFRSGRAYEDYTPSKDPLMQYTGVKDKNGVDIFVGDVVRISLIGGYSEGEVYQTESGEYCVNAYSLFPKRKSAEVLGTFYENPELLNS